MTLKRLLEQIFDIYGNITVLELPQSPDLFKIITNDFKGIYDEILVDELVEDSKWEILAKYTNSHGSYKEKYKSKEELSFA